jgi:Cu/Ag efflux protein CusF
MIHARVVPSMRATVVAAVSAIALLGFQSAVAQTPAPNAGQPAVGAEAVLHVQARVIGIEPDSNSVILQGPRGNIAVIDVNPDVADVKKLHVGDMLTIAYKRAVLVHVDKVASNGIRARVDTEAVQPASGGVVATGHMVEVLATVQKIDRQNRQVTLRGPTRTEVLDVSPDIPLDNLKVGDSVRAVFVSAIAAAVTRGGAKPQ